MKKIITISLLAFLYGSLVFALPGSKQYSAVWTANTEQDLAGYYLYWRTSNGAFNNTNKVDCGLSTSQLLTGVVPNKTILALTAYDSSGNESEFSSEVPFDQDDQAPNPPSGLSVQQVQ